MIWPGVVAGGGFAVTELFERGNVWARTSNMFSPQELLSYIGAVLGSKFLIA